MSTDKGQHVALHPFACGLAGLALTGALVLVGYDRTEANEEASIEALVIAPSSATLAVGEQVDFSAVARTASGDTVRDLALRWGSTDPAVFTVDDDGVATGQHAGSAYCNVELADEAAASARPLKAAKRPFPGLDSAFVF